MVPRVSESPVTMPAITSQDFLDTYLNEPALDDAVCRPSYQRRSTAPDSPNGSSPVEANNFSLPFRPRNRSPFARAHVRSRSSAGSLSAPQMTRAHSSPVPDTTSPRPFPATTVRPSSPLGPPGRRRSPLRKMSDESYSSFSSQVDIGETIAEHQELDLTPRASQDGGGNNIDTGIPISPLLSIHNSFPRIRRRPSSPFHPFLASPIANPPVSAPSLPVSMARLRTSTSSPSLQATQFNEPYPSNYSFSSSSVSSTPTSFRSRSPSISSLETIPDSPDAEVEAENIAMLKAAADREDAANKQDSDGEEGMTKRRTLGLGRSDKRKRWSVCGAERRGDLDLETIWED